MSFSIVSSDYGVVLLTIAGELDAAIICVLRLELSNLLRRCPGRVELHLTRPSLLDDAAKGLLLTFFDLLRAQGGLLVLCDLQDPPIPVLESLHMERLLRTQITSLERT